MSGTGDQAAGESSIGRCVRQALEEYFQNLDGEPPHEVQKMVLDAVERPMLEVVMRHARGNQTHAAQILGISRNTLHKKLVQYGLDG
jgi:Fis family transcriptional regulator